MAARDYRVSVLIPVSGQCPHRTMARRYVEAWYTARHPDYEIVAGHIPDSNPWCKAQAIAEAAKLASGDIFVIADADSFAPFLDKAVDSLSQGYTWAMPHYAVHRLSRSATEQVYRGSDPSGFPRNRSWYDQLPYVGLPGGGITVMHKDTYASTPLDHRYTGWGQEDESWAMALRILHGRGWRPSRDAPLWHMWHPPQPRISRSTGSENSRKLLDKYKQARTSDLMEALLAEPREFYRKGTVKSPAGQA